MTAEMVADWLTEPCMCGELAEAKYLDPRAIRNRAVDGLLAMAPLSARVLGRFAHLCARQSSPLGS